MSPFDADAVFAKYDTNSNPASTISFNHTNTKAITDPKSNSQYPVSSGPAQKYSNVLTNAINTFKSACIYKVDVEAISTTTTVKYAKRSQL